MSPIGVIIYRYQILVTWTKKFQGPSFVTVDVSRAIEEVESLLPDIRVAGGETVRELGGIFNGVRWIYCVGKAG